MWNEGVAPAGAWAYEVVENAPPEGCEGPSGLGWWRPLRETPGIEYAARSFTRFRPSDSGFTIRESEVYHRDHMPSPALKKLAQAARRRARA